MSKELIYLISFVLVLAVTGTASADQQTITIVNPGFEDPVLAEDDWTWLDIPGWTQVGGEGAGVWHVTLADGARRRKAPGIAFMRLDGVKLVHTPIVYLL